MKHLPLLLALLWLAVPVATAAQRPTLAALLANAQAGDTIEIEGGYYEGPLVITQSVTLIGRNWPIIDGGGKGTVITILAPDVRLEGFIIRNSGRSLDAENSGIVVQQAPRAIIAHNQIEETLFGIYMDQSNNSTINDNIIHSFEDVDLPRRGDAIRIWYSDDVLVENNVVTNARDVVLWYSSRLIVRGNEVRDGRYGLHFMYCDDAQLSDNLLYHNSVGAFMMYSRRIHLHHNTIASNRGPSGFGVGLKDMDDTIITDNLFLDNRVGIHIDGSPREVDSVGLFTGNVLGYNDIGLALLPSVRHNQFSNNSFVENQEQVAIEGGGAIADNDWSIAGHGNYWSDYAGFDADEDGRGDIPYRADRLFETLLETNPELRLFVYSPSASAVDFAAKAFPIVRPQSKLVDDFPLMQPIVPVGNPALPVPPQSSAVWVLSLLTLGSAVLMGWPWLKPTPRPQPTPTAVPQPACSD